MKRHFLTILGVNPWNIFVLDKLTYVVAELNKQLTAVC